jgi:hypothetical protein
MRTRRSLLVKTLAALALASAGLVAAFPTTGAAADPCWKRVVNDWHQDSDIDGSYSTSCLDEALDRVPEDIRSYSDFPEDVRNARRGALRTTQGADPDAQVAGAIGDDDKPDDGFFQKTLGSLGPDNADSVPLPLVVLAGLALVLMAGGAAGLLMRRLQARRLPGSDEPAQ